MISVLLCTHNSRKLLPLAIESYLHQTWQDRELVVIDDGEDLIEDMVKDLPNVQYHHYPARNLAEKRNEGLRHCNGELVAHFDSDDWSAPERIEHQVSHLADRKVVGYTRAWWYDTRKHVASYAPTGLWGASLLYVRDWALKYPWDERKFVCEDAYFLEPAHVQGAVTGVGGEDYFVALAHEGNMERPFGQDGWDVLDYENLPGGFRKSMEALDAIRQ